MLEFCFSPFLDVFIVVSCVVCLACMYVHASWLGPLSEEVRRKVSDALGLELQVVLSHHVGTGN